MSVVCDAHVTKAKPIYPEHERIRLLRALRCVDQVIACEAPGPEAVIERVLPDVYVRGPDYIGKEMPESDLLKQLRIPVRYTREGPDRTTKVKERIRGIWSASARNA